MKLPTTYSLILISTLLASATPAAFATVEDANTPTPATEEKAIPQAARSLSGSYLSGRFAHQTGDMERAQEFIDLALQRDPANTQLLTQSFRARMAQGDIAGAVAPAAQVSKSNDSELASMANMVLMLEQVKRGDFTTSTPVFEKASNDGFNSILYPIIYNWLLVGQGKIAKPVILEDVASAAGSFSPFVYYHLALINDLAGFNEAALTYYQKALNGMDKMPYRLVEALGNFYERTGAPEKSAALYKEYAASGAETIGMADDDVQGIISTTRKKGSAARLIPDATAGIAELYYTMGSLIYGAEANTDSLIYVQSALYLKPDFPQAQLMLGSIQAQAEEYENAIATFSSIDKKSPYYVKGQIKIAYIYYMQGDQARAIKQLDAISKQYPRQYESLYTKGDILRNKSRFVEAAEVYSEAIKRAVALGKKSWTLYFVRGVAFDRAGDWVRAETDLQKALSLEPNQPDVLNYIGYSWLLHGKNIEQAKGMIEQAIEARPDDAQIIDSMGWALYHMGDYTSAKDYLEQAIDLMPSDPTVNDHLGDVYWRLDRKTEARYQWQRALQFQPEMKEAQLIRDKLASGLPALAATTTVAKNQTAEKKPAQAADVSQ